MLELRRLGFRAGLGGGLAGAAWGGYHHPEEIPPVVATAAGAAGVPLAARSILKRLAKNKDYAKEIPTFTHLIENRDEIMDAIKDARRMKKPLDPVWKKALVRAGTRTLPLMLAGGLGGYMGANALMD